MKKQEVLLRVSMQSSSKSGVPCKRQSHSEAKGWCNTPHKG